MKKMKRFFALFLAMAMVLGMSMTTFAANEAVQIVAGTGDPASVGQGDSSSIVIKNLTPDEATTINVYKIIEFDATKSEWSVTNDAYKPYITFPNPAKDDAGNVKPAEINYAGLEPVLTEPVKSESVTVTTNAPDCIISGLDMGAYAITANGSSATGVGTTYTIMGTKTYDYQTNGLMTIANVVITAKGEKYQINKTFTTTLPDGTKQSEKLFVQKGEEISFDITMKFPSFGEGQQKRFTITDTPVGLEINKISVKIGDDPKTEGYELDKVLPTSEAVTVDLSSFIGDNNTNAGKDVVVTVVATVTSDTEYSNKATSNKAEEPEKPQVDGKSGSIVINKTDESDKVLTGARFSVSLKDAESALEFYKVSEANGVATYTLKREGEAAPAGVEQNDDLTVVGTDTASSIVLKGLGDGEYVIEEKLAPVGYSINNAIPNVELKDGSEESRNITTQVKDTTLSNLPSTGGIGTTIFTVGGCAIMILAAGMFFVSRRRASR